MATPAASRNLSPRSRPIGHCSRCSTPSITNGEPADGHCVGSCRLPKWNQESAISSNRERPNMPQAVVDPAEVRRFAGNLKRFNADLQTGLASIHGQMVGLSDTWRDQEHEKFREAFE